MKRILTWYIIREISSLFLLGLAIFTMVLLMGRLIKLTDLVISRGVPLADICRMILFLMPSFLVFTIPMAFLLAVLLAFGRLSNDNEITVMKASGLSLIQLMPPVMVAGFIAALLTLTVSTVAIPWCNSAFKQISFEILKENVSATIREKIFWDDIPNIIIYTEHYDEQRRALKGVIIYDGRERERPLVIFASDGKIGSAPKQGVSFELHNGSIHSPGKNDEYRLVNFGEYVMTIPSNSAGGIGRSEADMGLGELRRQIASPSASNSLRLKMAVEYHSRFAFPFASLVFAVVAVPLGIHNRRSGKSASFSISIGILLAYYVQLSFLRTMAEKGTIPPGLALWLPNIVFLGLGCYLLKMASQERSVLADVQEILLRLKRKVSKK